MSTTPPSKPGTPIPREKLTSQILPAASVVIPSFQRQEALLRCLEALSRQTFSSFEVVVVDDGSPTPLSLGAQNWASHLNVRLVRQANAGPAAARNRGAAEARAEVLAFTDDDCLPQPDWLATLVGEVHAHPEALVGSLTFNGLPQDPWAVTSQFILDLVYEHFNVRPENAYFLASNNIACRRSLYLELEGFDAQFPVAGGEDRDFCDRWRMRARPLRLVPRELLEHRHAQTLRQFLNLHWRYGRGAFLYQAQRRERQSGTMKDDLGFHRNLPRRLLTRLPTQGTLLRQGQIGVGLFLWQGVNALGFFYEALRQRRTAQKP